MSKLIRPEMRNRLAVCGNAARQDCLQFSDIKGVRRIRPPLDGQVILLQKLIGVRQGIAQLKKQLAQIGVRLFLTGIGPELESKVLTRLRGLAMQKQIGQ